MEILINEPPLMAMDCMRKFKQTIGQRQLANNNQSEKEKLITKFLDLFENNRTINDSEMNIQLKPGY